MTADEFLAALNTANEAINSGAWRVDVVKPWLIEIWEPLTAKVPSPALARPFCCYICTVIFYVRPYLVRDHHHFWRSRGKLQAEKPGGSFEEWGRVDTLLQWDMKIDFRGEQFEVGGGTVVWKRKRWWMRRSARRCAAAA
jgi:hypothetical protein